VKAMSQLPPHSGLFCLPCVGQYVTVQNMLANQEVIKTSRRMEAATAARDAVEEKAIEAGQEFDPETIIDVEEPDFSDLPVFELPGINEAVTLAPSWQNQQINTPQGLTMAMSCVAVPTCMQHISAHEVTAEEKAIQGGLLLGRGQVPPQGPKSPWGGN